MVPRSERRSLLITPAHYQIRVMGRLDTKWSDYLQGLKVMHVANATRGTGSTITELTGQLSDQAALMGVLWQLYSWGVSLISVRCNEWEDNLEVVVSGNTRCSKP